MLFKSWENGVLQIDQVGIHFKGGDELIVRKCKVVVPRVIEMDQCFEDSFVELRVENVKQLSMARLKTY